MIMGKHLYGLIELTDCPQKGEILRTEIMTTEEAKRHNDEMSGTIIEWQRLIGKNG